MDIGLRGGINRAETSHNIFLSQRDDYIGNLELNREKQSNSVTRPPSLNKISRNFSNSKNDKK